MSGFSIKVKVILSFKGDWLNLMEFSFDFDWFKDFTFSHFLSLEEALQ
jgi:hypothetical protein